MSEGGDSPNRIKVVDRRWFTEDGELRPGREVVPVPEGGGPSSAAGSEGAAAERRAPSSPDAQSAGPGPRESGETSAAFLELVETLAQQADLLMTGAQGLPRQPEQARRLIDYLGVLEAKTRGNLSVEESQLLSHVIFQLRARFVQSGV